MSAKRPTALERADVVWHYASALQAIGGPCEAGGYVAPNDIRMMLEHRLRAALRDGECPDCPDCALHAALEASLPESP